METNEFRHLIERSRYASAINYLLENQRLGTQKLKELEFDQVLQPNCFGTIAYLLGANQKVIDLWRKAGNKPGDTSKHGGEWVVIPEVNKPGYLGCAPMEMLLSTLKRGREIDSIICMYYPNNEFQVPPCAYRIQHTALHLGRLFRKNVVFHQPERGAKFEVGFLDDHADSIPIYRKTKFDLRYYLTSNAK